MKTVKTNILYLVAFLLVINFGAYAQRGHGHGKGHGYGHSGKTVMVKGHHHGPNKVVIVKSHYRPHKVIVYHPYWGPKYAFNRRWVYFPHYNFYWDNWRQSYLYWNGTIWINHVNPPPVIINVNIEKEKQYELKDTDDDVDDIYKSNDTHKTEYKPESE